VVIHKIVYTFISSVYSSECYHGSLVISIIVIDIHSHTNYRIADYLCKYKHRW